MFFDSEYDWAKHYQYWLPTGSYSVGTHELHFTVDGESAPVYVAPFRLR